MTTSAAEDRVLLSTVVTEYDYIYLGSHLVQMTVTATVDNGTPTTKTLNFAYDASGTPATVTYDGATYYYITNLQGDVMAILNSGGTAVVQYEYDAWGNILTTTGSMATTLGEANPLRYRGYVYDEETGLYYVSSRYYDPEIGRFINADVLVSTGQGLLGNNMFAYCRNNPVKRVDITGTADADCVSDDGELLSSDDIESRSGGGYGVYSGIIGGFAVALITGVANGVSTVESGGEFGEGFGVGFSMGALGYFLSSFTDSALTLVTIRAVTSFASDLWTNKTVNGQNTGDDIGFAVADAIMDGSYSLIAYYYNPFNLRLDTLGTFLKDGYNALIDGITDVAETYLFAGIPVLYPKSNGGYGVGGTIQYVQYS